MGNPSACGLSCAVFLLSAACPVAAQQFVGKETPTTYTNRVCEPADLDGDGDADLLTVSFAESKVEWNDGQNRFFAETLITTAYLSNRGAMGDFDTDGDIDYLTWSSTSGGSVLVMVRNQGGTFSVVNVVVPGLTLTSASTASALDYDGDGDLDALLYGQTTLQPQVVLLENVGAGVFVDASAQWIPAILSQAPHFCRVFDVDADGRPDLLFWGLETMLLRNTGTRFVDESGRLPQSAGRIERAAVADIDADGDQDLLVASLTARRLRLFENVGGRFVDVSRTHLASSLRSIYTAFFALLDADGDGDDDLYAYGSAPTLYRNDGAGHLLQSSPAVNFGPNVIGNLRISTVDLEGDGDLDLAMYDQSVAFLRNAGGGVLIDDSRVEWTDGDYDLMAADVDGDGDQDLLGGDHLGRNDGLGGFSMETIPHVLGSAAGTRFGDIDGDGDVDAVSNRLLLNDGTGRFLPAPGPTWVSSEVRSVAVADCDGDGDLDIVSCEGAPSAGIVRLHRNRGNAVFDPPVTLTTGPWYLAVDSADFDGDGDTDLLVSGALLGGSAQLLLQQANGTFAAQSLPFTSRARFVRFANHATLDLLVDANQTLQVFRLQAGMFVNVTASVFPAGFDAQRYAIGDVDGDGDVDLVANELLRNDGTGRLVPEVVSVSYYGHILADLDGDRDLELLGPGRVYWNREQHVLMPLPPHVGRNLRLELTSHPGRATAFEVALLGVALQRLPSGLAGPLGTLHLGALTSVLPVPIPPGTGMAAIDLPIPNAQALVGLPMYFQALLMSPGRVALSNCAATRIE